MSLSPADPLEGGQARPTGTVFIEARNLEVGYRSKGSFNPGLKGFSATFGPGITGLIGPNGAGKSTFLRTVCGLLEPRGGELKVGGKNPRAYVETHGVGFLPEVPHFPSFLTVGEFLDGVAGALADGAKPSTDYGYVPGLDLLLDRGVQELSQGQRKKVALGAALMGAPEVVLLDEPTNGLDPVAVRELRELLAELGRQGFTVVVSSHHLDELQRLADALVFVLDGKALGSWSREEALSAFGSLDVLYEQAFFGRIS